MSTIVHWKLQDIVKKYIIIKIKRKTFHGHELERHCYSYLNYQN